MKERPILFSAPMVRAILDGRKTQTRRFAHASSGAFWGHAAYVPCHLGSNMWHLMPKDGIGYASSNIKCPYGEVGDTLWVRENHYRLGHWKVIGETRTGRAKYAFVPYDDQVLCDAPSSYLKGRSVIHATPLWYKRLARFMPKSAARIKLRITNIRLERLQDITESDAIAEGIEQIGVNLYGKAVWMRYDFPDSAVKWSGTCNPIDSYRTLLNSIYGKDIWKENPWVWVIEFEKI